MTFRWILLPITLWIILPRLSGTGIARGDPFGVWETVRYRSLFVWALVEAGVVWAWALVVENFDDRIAWPLA
jgi:hypothetical protein